MGNISFGGLASGLDTTSIIQQLISLESRPITLLTQQQSTLQTESSAYRDLNTKISALDSAAFDLTQVSNLVAHKATSSDNNVLLATANTNAITGSYQVEVLQLATASRTHTGTGTGQGNTIGGISAITDFSNDTIGQINSANHLSADLSSGNFYVNGQAVAVNSSDTLNDIFARISTATGGAVTGQLATDSSKGGLVVQLSSASNITLGKGTSNFLSALKLDTASYSGGTLSSSDAINAVQADLKLDGSEGATNLAQIAVGSGTLTINGTAISYNDSQDSLNDLISRINASDAGVRAAFSAVGGGQVSLIDKNNGPLSIQISDTGGLAAALGLTASDSETLGQSAQIRVDGGAVQSFNQNSSISASGLDGIVLDLRDADPGNPVSVTVSANTDIAVNKVQNFVDKYNAVVSSIDDLTSFDPLTNTRGTLLGDFTINSVRDRLKSVVFEQVSGLVGNSTLGSLGELGLSTGAIGSIPGSTNTLQLDASKLRDALQSDPTRVAQIFGAEDTSTGSEGIASRLSSYLDGISSSTGIFNTKIKSNDSKVQELNDRINQLNDRLDKKQTLLQSQFTAMELTLSRLQTQQNSLTSLFTSIGH